MIEMKTRDSYGRRLEEVYGQCDLSSASVRSAKRLKLSVMILKVEKRGSKVVYFANVVALLRLSVEKGSAREEFCLRST